MHDASVSRMLAEKSGAKAPRLCGAGDEPRDVWKSIGPKRSPRPQRCSHLDELALFKDGHHCHVVLDRGEDNWPLDSRL